MKTYSVKETADKLNTNKRKIQRLCKKYNVRKKNNKYLITDELIETWKEPTTKPTTKTNNVATNDTTQLDLELEALKSENESLKERIKELEDEQIYIADNERLEVFTNEDYNTFEQRLKEWQTQRQELERQEQLFQDKQKSTKEILEHYKSQFEYQKKQNDKILEMHQTLLDTIEAQNKLAIQRNTIEAIDKDIINRDTWKRKE